MPDLPVSSNWTGFGQMPVVLSLQGEVGGGGEEDGDGRKNMP